MGNFYTPQGQLTPDPRAKFIATLQASDSVV